MKPFCSRCKADIPPDKIRCEQCGKLNLSSDPAKGTVISLAKVERKEKSLRIVTGPWDPCFGGGIHDEGVILFGGEPGAGKSTLMCQIAARIIESNLEKQVVYVASEEGLNSIAERADRLGISREIQTQIMMVDAMGGEFDLHGLPKGALMILDSLPGFAGEGTSKQDDSLMICKILKQMAVENKSPAIIIDHITKQEDFAGFMALQHAVDTTLMFTVDEKLGVRTLTTVKNRHGAAPVRVTLHMTVKGLTEGVNEVRVYEEDQLVCPNCMRSNNASRLACGYCTAELTYRET